MSKELKEKVIEERTYDLSLLTREERGNLLKEFLFDDAYDTELYLRLLRVDSDPTIVFTCEDLCLFIDLLHNRINHYRSFMLDDSAFIDIYIDDCVLCRTTLTKLTALTELEEAREVAKKLGIPFSNRFADGGDDDIDPYVYDGSMSLEDFRKVQERHFGGEENHSGRE